MAVRDWLLSILKHGKVTCKISPSSQAKELNTIPGAAAGRPAVAPPAKFHLAIQLWEDIKVVVVVVVLLLHCFYTHTNMTMIRC